jgi:hypothetical protein
MIESPRFDAVLTPGAHHREEFGSFPGFWTLSARRGNGFMLEAFIEAPLRYRQLSVFPVVAPNGPSLPYVLSPAARDSGVLTVRERGHGSDPLLLMRNHNLHHLLIPAGEPLPGDSPGRVVGRSFLLRGGSVNQLPASSVERTDWLPPEREAEITEWAERFPVRRNQVGSLAFLGSRLHSLETFGAANLYEQMHRRLMVRFIREALKRGDPPTAQEQVRDLRSLTGIAREFLERLEMAHRSEDQRIGLGRYWLLDGPVSGGELIHQGVLIHVSARPAPFPAIGATGEET